MEKALDKLFEAIDDIVNDNGSFAEKRDAVLAAMAVSESREVNFNEFLSWFE